MVNAILVVVLLLMIALILDYFKIPKIETFNNIGLEDYRILNNYPEFGISYDSKFDQYQAIHRNMYNNFDRAYGYTADYSEFDNANYPRIPNYYDINT